MRQASVVLGMHRSGTSAFAGMLSLLGAKPPNRPLPPGPANPKGYFEPEPIVATHDRLLAAAGTGWSSFDRIPNEWFVSARGVSFENETVRLVQDEFNDAPWFVLKDPRICLLLPLWHRVLERVNARSHFVIVVRNPIEVARSLKQRDGLDTTQMSLVWLQYMLAAERETRGRLRMFASYHDLLDQPLHIAKRVMKQLGFDAGALTSKIATEVLEFIDGALCHHRAEMQEFDSSMTYRHWVTQTIKALAILMNCPDDTAAQRELDRVAAGFDIAVPSLAALGKNRDHRIEKQARLLSQKERAITSPAQGAIEGKNKFSVFDNTLFECASQIGVLENAIAEHNKKTASLDQLLSDCTSKIITLSHNYQNTLSKL